MMLIRRAIVLVLRRVVLRMLDKSDYDYFIMISWFFMGMLQNALMHLFGFTAILLIPFWWIIGKGLYNLRFKGCR